MYNFVGSLAPAVISIVVLPFYLSLIGIERYGALALLWTLTGAFSFLNLGLGPAITQKLAAQQLSDEQSSDSVWTGLAAGLGAAMIAAILVIFAGRIYFSQFAHIGSTMASEVRDALPYFALAMPAGFASGVLSGALQGRRRFLELNIVQVVSAALSSIVPLVVALYVGPHLSNLAVATLVVAIFTSTLSVWMCRRFVPLLRPRKPDAATLRNLMKFGGWVSVTGLIAPMVFQFDRFIIGMLRGASAVSHYIIPLNLVQRLLLLPASLQSALFPELASTDPSKRSTVQGVALDALSALLTPCAILGMAILGPFLTVWLGKEISQYSTEAGIILAVGFWIHGVTHVASTTLLGDGRPDLISKLLLVYVAPYLVLAWFLIDRFGIVGASFAWVIRAGIEPILFVWSKPPITSLKRLLFSFLLVAGMATVAVETKWTDAIYWLAFVALGSASLFIYREFWQTNLARRRRT